MHPECTFNEEPDPLLFQKSFYAQGGPRKRKAMVSMAMCCEIDLVKVTCSLYTQVDKHLHPERTFNGEPGPLLLQKSFYAQGGLQKRKAMVSIVMCFAIALIKVTCCYFWACGVDRGQSYGNIEDNWRFLPADESTRVDAPAITRRPPPW